MQKKIWSGGFWLDAVERAVGAAAGSALAVLGADGLGVLTADWQAAASVAGLAAVVSVLKSLVAGTTGDPSTAGFTGGSR